MKNTGKNEGTKGKKMMKNFKNGEKRKKNEAKLVEKMEEKFVEE